MSAEDNYMQEVAAYESEVAAYESYQAKSDACDDFCERYKKVYISILKAMLASLENQAAEDNDEFFHECTPTNNEMEIHSQGINYALDRIYRELMNTIFQERLKHIISTMPELPDGYEYSFDYNEYLGAPNRQFFEANDLKKFMHQQKKIDLLEDWGTVRPRFDEHDIEALDTYFKKSSKPITDFTLAGIAWDMNFASCDII